MGHTYGVNSVPIASRSREWRKVSIRSNPFGQYQPGSGEQVHSYGGRCAQSFRLLLNYVAGFFKAEDDRSSL
jgi:hypothetical protein